MLAKIKWYYPVGIIALLVVFLLWSLRTGQREEFSLIGIPDGAAGLLARYVLDEKMGTTAIRGIRFEAYTLYDCCASASQYAMGSGHLDAAIVCPDTARELVEKGDSFEITGPVMMNSDIFITRLDPGLSRQQIAISQKRSFQREMVTQRFGAAGKAVPMFHGAVPFAFARGVVQGAVLDITKALPLQGEIASAVTDGHEVCTYVMVNKKEIRNTDGFRRFLADYEKAVLEMDDAENLLRLMQTYVSANTTRGDVVQWKKMNVRFICPFSYLPQG